MNRIIRSCFFAVVVLAGSLAHAAEPVRAIPYAGKLEVDGSAPSASFEMKFALFEVSENGTPLWEETMSVAVTSGAFAVVLGTNVAKPLPDNVFTAGALYIEVMIDPANAKTVLEPRQQVFAAPQAIRGRTAEYFSVLNELAMGTAGQASTIRGSYRLHISSEEILYLLAKGGVMITSNWGGPGTLTVENLLTAGGVSTGGAISAGSLSAGSISTSGLTTGNLIANGAVTAGSLTIGDLSLAAAGSGAGPHIQGANTYGSLHIDNRNVGGSGGIYLNYTTKKPVYFGVAMAQVDANTGDISTKGGIRAHSDAPSRCQTVVDGCNGGTNPPPVASCPGDMYLQSVYIRSSCTTAVCCYIGGP